MQLHQRANVDPAAGCRQGEFRRLGVNDKRPRCGNCAVLRADSVHRYRRDFCHVLRVQHAAGRNRRDARGAVERVDNLLIRGILGQNRRLDGRGLPAAEFFRAADSQRLDRFLYLDSELRADTRAVRRRRGNRHRTRLERGHNAICIHRRNALVAGRPSDALRGIFRQNARRQLKRLVFAVHINVVSRRGNGNRRYRGQNLHGVRRRNRAVLRADRRYRDGHRRGEPLASLQAPMPVNGRDVFAAIHRPDNLLVRRRSGGDDGVQRDGFSLRDGTCAADFQRTDRAADRQGDFRRAV